MKEEKRSREHIETILRLKDPSHASATHPQESAQGPQDKLSGYRERTCALFLANEGVRFNLSRCLDRGDQGILDDLAKVYRSSIQPLEEVYKYSQLKCQSNQVAEIYANPSLLFLGPWSSGKTSMINYLLALEGRQALRTGVEPTTSDFVIIDHGPKHKVLPGTTLLSDAAKPYKPLEHYGMNFAAGLQGVEFPAKLLKRLTIIDTPGVLECKEPQKRGYPFNEVCQWFIDRASLIFLVLDPSKLDAGKQLRELFQKIKGHESKVRIIMNKADCIDSFALTRAYGAFFWNLRQFMPNLVEPPKVYVVSFWDQPFKDDARKNVFLAEETSLLYDIQKKIENHLQETMASLLRHAIRVKTHAMVVNTYLSVYYNYHHRWLRWKNSELKGDIVCYPDQFDIPQQVVASSKSHASGVLDVLTYKRFFQANPLDAFRPSSDYRDGILFAGPTIVEKIQAAIETGIPQLLTKHRKVTSKLKKQSSGTEEKNTSWSLKYLLSLSQEQFSSLLSKNPLGMVWDYTPLGFLAQKVQNNIDHYKRC